MRNERDAKLDKLLPGQYGAFAYSQARRLGFTPRMVDGRLAQGQWFRVDTGVYRHAAYRCTWEQRCMCALLSRPGALLAGHTAAALHELTAFNRGRIELVVPPTASGRSRLATVHRSELRQPVRVRGLTVQSVPCTLLEVAGIVPQAKLRRAVEDAIIDGKVSADALLDWYVRMVTSRRHGVASMRAVLDSLVIGEQVAESKLEKRLHEALRHDEIPPFTSQAPFPWSPNEPFRVDVFIDAWGMIIEGDGRRLHARLETMEADRGRDRDAVRRGYLPVRFGWGDLRDPDEVRRTVVDIARSHGRLLPQAV